MQRAFTYGVLADAIPSEPDINPVHRGLSDSNASEKSVQVKIYFQFRECNDWVLVQRKT
jgi:hypothetical protein